MTLSVLPTFPGLAWNGTKAQVWSTREMTAASGKEYRAQSWSYPRYKFSLPLQFLRTYGSYSELQSLLGFIGKNAGMFGNWLYNDPTDNTATSQAIGTGDGATTSFPLVRTIGGYTEPVLAVTSISSVLVSNASTSAYSLTSTYGYANDTITFNTAPASSAPIVATFTFYFVCRFLQDDITLSNFMSGRWECKSLDFESVK